MKRSALGCHCSRGMHAHTPAPADENSPSSLIFPFPSACAQKSTPGRGVGGATTRWRPHGFHHGKLGWHRSLMAAFARLWRGSLPPRTHSRSWTWCFALDEVKAPGWTLKKPRQQNAMLRGHRGTDGRDKVGAEGSWHTQGSRASPAELRLSAPGYLWVPHGTAETSKTPAAAAR